MDLTWVWQSMWSFAIAHVPAFYISPFWYWAAVGAAVIFAAWALAYFFSPLKPFAGAVVMAVIAGLVGYRRGEKDAEAHDKATSKPKSKPAPHVMRAQAE